MIALETIQRDRLVVNVSSQDRMCDSLKLRRGESAFVDVYIRVVGRAATFTSADPLMIKIVVMVENPVLM